MAFGRLERSTHPPPMSDINMTPLIDVMLVLLVIFMISAPLITASLKLDLPQAEAATASDTPDFISVAIDPKGALYVDEKPLSASDFETRITRAAESNPHTEVRLRADKTVPYGRVAELIGVVQKAGLTRIGFVTEPPAPAASPAR